MVFNDTDTDKDGQLDAQELQQFVHEMTNKRVDKVFSEQEQQQIFADLDNDGNGALTKENARELNAKMYTEQEYGINLIRLYLNFNCRNE